MNLSIQGKTAIVTGAGSGIGRASAEIMAREGAFVVVSDLREEAAEDVAGAIRSAGGQARAMAVDVTEDQQLERLVSGTVAEAGRLDILHSHAGIQVEGTLEQVDPAGMDASWELNGRAHFTAARLSVPHMRAQGRGAIVITSSNSGVLHDREMIAALGVDISKLYTLVFALGAALAGLAGALVGAIQSIQVGMGEPVLILAFVVIVIGGIGSIRGAFIGALLVGLTDTLGGVFLPELFKLFMDTGAAQKSGSAIASMGIYILMGLVLIWRPTGLFGARA